MGKRSVFVHRGQAMLCSQTYETLFLCVEECRRHRHDRVDAFSEGQDKSRLYLIGTTDFQTGKGEPERTCSDLDRRDHRLSLPCLVKDTNTSKPWESFSEKFQPLDVEP